MTFGSLLARYRRQKQMSQMDLSAASSVSQRHISFLESGRAQPGAATVRRLSDALALDFASENALFESGGFSPPRAVFAWSDPCFDSARRVLERTLARHAPFPAVVTHRNGDVLMTNPGFDRLLSWAYGGDDPWNLVTGTRARNLFTLTLHPRGLLQFMRNPEEIVPHTLRRLKRAAAQDETAERVLAACLRHKPVARLASAPETSGSETSSVLTEHYAVKGNLLSFVSMIASFGSPEDVTSQSVQIELFFPDDRATSQLMQQLTS